MLVQWGDGSRAVSPAIDAREMSDKHRRRVSRGRLCSTYEVDEPMLQLFHSLWRKSEMIFALSDIHQAGSDKETKNTPAQRAVLALANKFTGAHAQANY